MKLTVEKTLMYEVMKAIYDSGIPIDFKGSMVLKRDIAIAIILFLLVVFSGAFPVPN